MAIRSAEATVATEERSLWEKNDTGWKPFSHLIMKEHLFFLNLDFSRRSPLVVHFDNDWHFSPCSFESAYVPKQDLVVFFMCSSQRANKIISLR